MAIFTDIFEDVTKQGRKIPTSDYRETGAHPIIDQGQSAIAGYTDETDGLFTDVPAIIFGDHTRVLKYVDTPCFLGADGVKLLKAKTANPNYKYLYYVLSNASIPNTGYNRHFKWLKEVDIPLPNADKQQEIVDTLDKISELIALRKEQLAKLDQLVKSRFVELIQSNNPRYVKLKDVVEEGRIITYGIVKPGEHTEGGVPIIKVKDFPNGTILMNDMLLASPEIESKYERSRVKEGDLLFSIRGSVGRTAFVPKSLIGANITQDTARVSVGTDCNPHYIRAALGFDSVQKEINEHVRGVAVRGISLAELREIGIPVLEKKTQDEFGRFVEQTDKSKLAIQQSLEKLELLKKSLMQEYFG